MAIRRSLEDDRSLAGQPLSVLTHSAPPVATRRDVQRAKALLQGGRQRVTPQRVALLAALLGDHLHPTATELYAKLRVGQPSLSLATVYKNLATLARMRLVVQVNVPGDNERFEANLHPHANFLCTSCHELTDIDGPQFEEFEERVRATVKGGVDQVQILIRGTCARCRRRGKS